ncbi:hypothetical protein EVA_13389 [gut metagenome]|uniref:Uncharacterized protein n=1 Tax=gut metagenome TaxID=749906 RepID=J9FVF7_9ZZZZ
MDNKIRILCFFQGAFKSLNQMMRQLPYKSYSIRQI